MSFFVIAEDLPRWNTRKRDEKFSGGIPFVLLAAGIAIRVAVNIFVNKKKVVRLKEAHKE